jgi:hypothetical protein
VTQNDDARSEGECSLSLNMMCDFLSAENTGR